MMRNLLADETIDLRSLSEIVMRWRAAVGHSAPSRTASPSAASCRVSTARRPPPSWPCRRIPPHRARALPRTRSRALARPARRRHVDRPRRRDPSGVRASRRPGADSHSRSSRSRRGPCSYLPGWTISLSRPRAPARLRSESLGPGDLTLVILTADGRRPQRAHRPRRVRSGAQRRALRPARHRRAGLLSGSAPARRARQRHAHRRRSAGGLRRVARPRGDGDHATGRLNVNGASGHCDFCTYSGDADAVRASWPAMLRDTPRSRSGSGMRVDAGAPRPRR